MQIKRGIIMYQGKTVLAVIPMRGGSKGLPGKNGISLCGKPLMYYTIADAKKSRYIDRLVAFTDDEGLAAMAREYGAETPYQEPAWLATDDMNETQIFPYLLGKLAEDGYIPDIVLQLRTISPIRPEGVIDKGIEMLVNGHADCLRTMSPAPVTPYKLWVPSELGTVKPFAILSNSEKKPQFRKIPSYNMPRQELPKVYWHNPILDVIWYDTIMTKHSMSGDEIMPLYIEDPIYSIDIDTELDLMVAEAIMKRRVK
jgi:N-acylneuraminate cytidylyltransferase